MPVIDGQIVNMETFQGKDGKAPYKVIQVLETIGKMASLVEVADFSKSEQGFKVGQKVQIPVLDGIKVDKFTGVARVTYTFFGFKNGNGNGNGNGKEAASNGPGNRPSAV